MKLSEPTTQKRNNRYLALLLTAFSLTHATRVSASELPVLAQTTEALNADASSSPNWDGCRATLKEFQSQVEQKKLEDSLKTLVKLEREGSQLSDLKNSVRTFGLELLMESAIIALVNAGYDDEAEKLLRKRLNVLAPYLVSTDPAHIRAKDAAGRLYISFVKTENMKKNSAAADKIMPDLLAFYKKSFGDTSLQYAFALRAAGQVKRDLGNLKAAEKSFLESANILKSKNNASEAAMSLLYLGYTYALDGQPQLASDTYKIALSSLTDDKAKIKVIDRLITACEESADLAGKIEARKQKLEILRRSGAASDTIDEENYLLAGDLNLAGKYTDSDTAYGDTLRHLDTVTPSPRQKVVRVMAESALVKQALKQPKEAELLLKTALAECEKHPSTESAWNDLRSTVSHNLGVLYFREKNYSLAAKYIRDGIEIAEKFNSHKDEPADSAAAYTSLGETLLRESKPSEAEEPLRKALTLRLKTSNVEEIARAQYELSHCLGKLKKYAEAETLARQAYSTCMANKEKFDSGLVRRISERLSDSLYSNTGEATEIWRHELDVLDSEKDTAKFCTTAIKLAIGLLDSGKIDEAEKLLDRADEKAKTLTSGIYSHNLLIRRAKLQQARQNLSEAERLLLDALKYSQANPGETRGVLLQDLTNLAMFYDESGKIQESNKYTEQAIELSATRGKKDSYSLETQICQSDMLSRNGKTDEACEVLSEALKLAEELGQSRSTISIYARLGEIEMRTGKLSAAEEHLKKVLTSELSSPSLQTIALSNLALVYAKMGQVEEAQKLIRTAQVNLGPPSTSNWWPLMRILQAQADIAARSGNLDEGLRLKNEALSMATKYNRNDSMLAVLHGQIAQILFSKGDSIGAKREAEKSIALSRSANGENSQRHAQLLSDLSQITSWQSAGSVASVKSTSPSETFRETVNELLQLTSMKKFTEALEQSSNALKKLDATDPSTYSLQALHYAVQARCFRQLKSSKEQEVCFQLALEKLRQVKTEDCEAQSFVYDLLAGMKSSDKNFEDALPLREKACSLLKNAGLQNSFRYPTTLTYYAMCLNDTGKTAEAYSVALEAIERLKVLAGTIRLLDLNATPPAWRNTTMKFMKETVRIQGNTPADERRAIAEYKSLLAEKFLDLANVCRASDTDACRMTLELAAQQIQSISPADYGANQRDAAAVGLSHKFAAVAEEFLAIGDLGRAIELTETRLNLLPENQKESVVNACCDLAFMLTRTGDFDRAETFSARAISLAETEEGKSARGYAIYGIASELQERKGNIAEAINLQHKAERFLENADEKFRVDLIDCICRLAYLLVLDGQTQKADEAWEKFLQLERDYKLEGTVSQFAQAKFLSLRYLTRGDYKTAEELLLEMVSANKAVDKEFMNFGDGTRIYNNLCVNRLKQGVSSLEFALASAESVERTSKLATRILPLSEQANYLGANLQICANMLLSAGTADGALEKTYPHLLKWKGLLVESIRQETASSKVLTIQQARLEAEQLSQQLESLGDSDKDKQKRELLLNELSAARRRVREKLAAVPKNDLLTDKPLEALRNALRTDEIFLDIYKYAQPNILINNKDEHYCAILTVKNGAIQQIDLGTASELDKSIQEWLKQLSDGSSVNRTISQVKTPSTSKSKLDFNTIANQFYSSVWSKIEPHLSAQTRRIIISPDSELAKVPWDVLVNQSGKRSREIGIADSPRLFVASRTSPAVPRLERLITLSGAIDFKDAPQLPQTGREVDAIATYAKAVNIKADLLKNDMPTKSKLLEVLPLATFVHLATHGFFASEEIQNDGSTFRSVKIETDSNQREAVVKGGFVTRDPLTLSGIVIAPSKDDPAGILTAAELVGIDLRKCDLFTLSACQTALGESYTGQGVVGLRAALEAAGCKSVLMSMWKVDDDATRALMTKFYEELWKKPNAKIECLRSAQDFVRSHKGWEDPYYWAAWVLAGDAW